MRRLRATLVAFVTVAFVVAGPLPSLAKKGSSNHHYHSTHSHKRGGHKGGSHKGSSHFATKRSKKARDDFMKSNPCPSTGRKSGACPGYVVDHVVPLKRGGPDAPSNMQWQTVEQGKAKDKWE